jgi:VIT1/CCC1 family predicted Fe2+/Mn2+ transporter
VVIPFLLISTPSTALRVSNAVAVAMLFVGGVSLGRFSGLHSWALGLGLAALGAVLVAITIALGG